VPTIWLDATPSGPSMPPPTSSPNFMLDALPAATLPIYPGSGQAPNMLDCIPGGLVANRQITSTIITHVTMAKPADLCWSNM